MERGSDKHSPRLDDEMEHEVRGLLQGNGGGRVEEFRDPEPSGEDEPAVSYAPEGDLHGGTPDGMTEADVERRAELARFLRPSSFPAVREILIGDAMDDGAPAWVVTELKRLPSGREYANVGDVWRTLGHGAEERRQ
jgi:hypothetical protein